LNNEKHYYNEENIKFITDSMLGNIARKLRLFGFDVLYYKKGDDEGLLRNFKDRILLTCDKELYKRCFSLGRKAIFVERSENELDSLSYIFKSLKIKPVLKATRCTVCNGKLRKMNKEEIIKNQNIPQNTKSKYKEFYVCTNCGKVYWFGSHWKNIIEFNEKLKSTFK